MQLPLTQVDNICKVIPYNAADPVSLKELIKEDTQIKKMINNDKNLKHYLKFLQFWRVY